MTEEILVPVFMPPLVNLLVNAERLKGSALTKEEVLAMRDKAVCMMLRQTAAREMAAKRGYVDINPATVWEEWQVARKTLQKP